LILQISPVKNQISLQLRLIERLLKNLFWVELGSDQAERLAVKDRFKKIVPFLGLKMIFWHQKMKQVEFGDAEVAPNVVWLPGWGVWSCLGDLTAYTGFGTRCSVSWYAHNLTRSRLGAATALDPQGWIRVFAWSSQFVWGLCGENCQKYAKLYKISKNVEFGMDMITVSYLNLRRLGNSRSLTSNPKAVGLCASGGLSAAKFRRILAGFESCPRKVGLHLHLFRIK
jgi:hypothetical protein